MPASKRWRSLTTQGCGETRARGRSPPAQRADLWLARGGAGQGDLSRPQLSRTRQGRLAARQHSEISHHLHARPHLARAARAGDHPAKGIGNARLRSRAHLRRRQAGQAPHGCKCLCIAGYSYGNEGSVREFQRKTTQWAMGKNFDHTGGFGPWMVTADEVPPGGKGLKIESRLNGQVMQSDNTDNMMFPVAETIAYITQGMTLEPGDIVFTGTPSGVGHARKPNPVWMKAGDTCEIEIEGVGVLVNPIANEK